MIHWNEGNRAASGRGRLPSPRFVGGRLYACPSLESQSCGTGRSSVGMSRGVNTPTGKPFRVRLDKLKGRQVQAWWFDPRTGEFQAGCAMVARKAPPKRLGRAAPPSSQALRPET